MNRLSLSSISYSGSLNPVPPEEIPDRGKSEQLALVFLTGFPVEGEGSTKKQFSEEKWKTKLFGINLIYH